MPANPAPTQRKQAPAWRQFTLTAYTAQCPGCSGVTATGIDVHHTVRTEGKRIIAVDPVVIPLGSVVKVRFSDGRTVEAVAGDTGGAIDGRHVDLLVATRAKALRIGRETVELRIISKEGD